MFIIFGNGFKTYIEAKGKFNCPNCKKKEIYDSIFSRMILDNSKIKKELNI